MRKGGYPDRWADIQSAQLYSGNNFCQALVFLKCHFPHQDAPRPRSLGNNNVRVNSDLILSLGDFLSLLGAH